MVETISDSTGWKTFDDSDQYHTEGPRPSSYYTDGDGGTSVYRWKHHGLDHRMDGPDWVSPVMKFFSVNGEALIGRLLLW